MAASMQKLSHKQYRALLKKEKRKKKRQEAARLRQGEESLRGKTSEDEEEEENDLQEQEEVIRERAHRAWLQRERVAQILFEKKKEQEREWKEQQKEAERKIEEELERQKAMEEEFLSSSTAKKTKKEKLLEDALHILSDEDDRNEENTNQPTHNPEAPKHLERKQEECMFYLKTGACRFGNRCSRHHPYPIISTTLLIRGMFTCYSMEQSYRDEYDADIALEFDETETQTAFLEFYDDVLAEFRKAGKVVQFKVCKNWESHLRGNVYVEFESEASCSSAFSMFNARFYAGRQMSCEYSPVTNWKAAICGLFYQKKCPKGKNCNFLHVFRNPGNEFFESDRASGMRGSQRGDWSSRRSHMGSERSFRTHHRLRSRDDEREYSRRRHRSRSKDRRRRGSKERRRSRSHSRERKRSKSRERHRKRKKNKSKERYSNRDDVKRRECSKSRDRSRSNSRERKQIKGRSSRSRDRSRSNSRERKQIKGRSSRSRDRSRSNSRERKQIKGRSSRSRDRSRSNSRERKQERCKERRSHSQSRETAHYQIHSHSTSPEESSRRSRSGSREAIQRSKRSQSRNRDGKKQGNSRNSSYEREIKLEKRPKQTSPNQMDRSRSSSREGSQGSLQKETNFIVSNIKQMLEEKYMNKHKKSKHKKHKKDKRVNKMIDDHNSESEKKSAKNDKDC